MRVNLMLSVLTTERGKTKGHKKTWEVLEISITLIMMIISGMSAYVQTYQIIH